MSKVDPMREIFNLIEKEKIRQEETLMMIPSENYTYPEVRQVVGSILMHKYAEGQPGRRYYQGMEFVDQIERICEREALKAFSLSPEEWGVNVQALSGSPANLAVYNALLSPGDKIMSLYLPEGGHLSHGWHQGDKKVTLASKIYDVGFYHVDPKTEVLDYADVEKQAEVFHPKLIVSGGTAYPREIDYKKMAEIAHGVGAYYLADIAHEAGLVVGGANRSPFPYADVVTMTTHKTLRGPRGALIFSRKELSDQIDSSVFPGLQGGPHLHTIAGIAVCLSKDQSPEFKDYAKQTVINAKRLAKNLRELGYDVISGGTDKHLVLIDLSNKNLNGWFAARALEDAGIVVNRNTVPYKSDSSFYPSGLRLGTPAITTRGMKEKEIDQISSWFDAVLKHIGTRGVPEDKEERKACLDKFEVEVKSDAFLKKIAREVKVLCQKFPVK